MASCSGGSGEGQGRLDGPRSKIPSPRVRLEQSSFAASAERSAEEVTGTSCTYRNPNFSSDRILAANRSAMIALVPRVVAQPGALESRLTNDGAE